MNNIGSVYIIQNMAKVWDPPNYDRLFDKEVTKRNPDINKLEWYIKCLSKEKIIKLTILNLSLKGLSRIPAGISNLINLRELYLACNYINIIPKEIGNLANLQILYLYNNRIDNIPNDVERLNNLQCINLKYNKISNIPDIIHNIRFVYL